MRIFRWRDGNKHSPGDPRWRGWCLTNRDCDRLGHHRRHKRDVGPIGEEKLESVFAFREGYHGFGLAAAKVLVGIVGWNGLLHLLRCHARAEYQVIVARGGLFS